MKSIYEISIIYAYYSLPFPYKVYCHLSELRSDYNYTTQHNLSFNRESRIYPHLSE